MPRRPQSLALRGWRKLAPQCSGNACRGEREVCDGNDYRQTFLGKTFPSKKERGEASVDRGYIDGRWRGKHRHRTTILAAWIWPLLRAYLIHGSVERFVLRPPRGHSASPACTKFPSNSPMVPLLPTAISLVPCIITIQSVQGGSIYCHPPSPYGLQSDKIFITLCKICLSEIVISPTCFFRSRLMAQNVLVILMSPFRSCEKRYVCGVSIQG